MKNTNIELTAAREYIERCVLPIIQVNDSGQAGISGSGFIINYKDVLFLCTNAHVLKETELIKYSELAIPIAGQNKGLMTFPHQPFCTNNNINDCDVGIVPLVYQDKYLNEIKDNWNLLTLDSFVTTEENSSQTEYIVHGFPRSLQKSIEPNPNISTSNISFLVELYSGKNEEIENFNESIDIIFNYRNEMQTKNGMELIPDLHGISGSPIFSVEYHDTSKLWIPSERVKLIGLEKAVFVDKYIRATKSKCLYDLLVKSLPKIYTDIKRDFVK